MTDVAFADLFTFARATTGWRVNASGLIESVSSGNPRFQYDPITLNKLGLLIEAQRTNLRVNSSVFSSNFTASQVTATDNVAVAPDGTTTGASLVPSTTSAQHFLLAGVTSSGTISFSIFAKANGYRWLSIQAAGASGFAYFDLVAGVTANVSAGYTATIEAYPDGWYRCSVVTTYVNNLFYIFVQPSATQATWSADGTSGIYLWGMQVEQAAYAASYIPTGASQVTRNADSVQITGTDFTDWWNAAAGTYGVTARSSGTSTRPLLSFDDDTTNEQILLRTVGTDLKLTMIDGGVTVADLTIGTIVPDQQFAVAFTFDATGVAASLNGGAPVSDSAITLPTVSRARIGQDKAGNYLGGVIARAVGRPVRVSNGLLRRLAA